MHINLSTLESAVEHSELKNCFIIRLQCNYGSGTS